MPAVLIVAASPLDLDRLSLNREVKKIKQSLERSRNRENWRIESNEAATVEDLRRALLDYQPTVVHFCGHGGGDGALYFEDDQGLTHPTHPAPLTRLFHCFKDKLKCIVLNACYSESQAIAIRQEIDYVVGMRKSIGDDAAIRFAVAFYDAVFAGTEFRVAFDLGCTEIDLHNLPDTDVPVFLTSPQLGGAVLSYTENIPEIEDFLQAYLNTPYVERHHFAAKGEELADAMKQFYGDRMMYSVRKVTVIAMQQIGNWHWKVRARIWAAGERGHHDYYLRIEDRSIKINWEATVGLWSTPVKTYLAFGTKENIVARVTAEIGSYYNGYFRDKEQVFQNVKLRTSRGESLHGYVDRASPCYEDLLNIVRDGNPHDITLAIRSVNEETEYPLITAVLSRNWIMLDDEPKPPGSS